MKLNKHSSKIFKVGYVNKHKPWIDNHYYDINQLVYYHGLASIYCLDELYLETPPIRIPLPFNEIRLINEKKKQS